MPKHPFDIRPNGEVLYDGTRYHRTAVEALIHQLKAKLENHQSEAVGHYLGYVVTLEGKSYSHLKIGCESFDTRTVQAFIEDYENCAKGPIVKMGNRLIGPGGDEYIVAKAVSSLADPVPMFTLICLSTGNTWAEPVKVTSYRAAVALSQFVKPNRLHQFKLKEE